MGVRTYQYMSVHGGVIHTSGWWGKGCSRFDSRKPRTHAKNTETAFKYLIPSRTQKFFESMADFSEPENGRGIA
jgi:hypothetical protein